MILRFVSEVFCLQVTQNQTFCLLTRGSFLWCGTKNSTVVGLLEVCLKKKGTGTGTETETKTKTNFASSYSLLTGAFQKI